MAFSIPTADLLDHPRNPLPDGVVSGLVSSTGGVELRWARWPALASPSKGTVILLHGRSEYIEKYFETVEDLRQRGFGVLTFDWRGQGGSTRLLGDPYKGHVEHFNQYLDDLEAVLTEIALPDCRPPHFIMGHSTGALVALLAAPALGNRIKRMLLLAPMLQIADLPVKQSVIQKAMSVFSTVGFGRAFAPGVKRGPEALPFVANKLSSDPVRFGRNAAIAASAEELTIAGPTISWVFSAMQAMEQIHESGYAAAIHIPTLLIAAGSDHVVSPGAIERYGRRMRTGSFLTVSGAKHELLQERDLYREQVLAAFDAFIPGSDPFSG